MVCQSGQKCLLKDDIIANWISLVFIILLFIYIRKLYIKRCMILTTF